MMTQKTIAELAEWIVTNRKGNAFKNDTFENIVAGLQEDVPNGNVLFVLDESGEFIGVMTFIIDRVNFLFFVKNILLTRYACLPIFAQHFTEHYKGYAVCANRYNEEIMYDTSRLVGHLLGMKKQSKGGVR